MTPETPRPDEGSAPSASSDPPSPLIAAALAQLAEGVIVVNEKGRIIFVNAAAAALHGVATLDVPIEEYASAYHLFTEAGEPFPPGELPLARAARDGEHVIDARWRVRRPNGDEITAIGSARPVLDREGRQIGAVLTVRDDTDRQAGLRAERERDAVANQLREAFEQSPLSTVVYDAAGHPIAANPAFGRLWGVGMSDVPRDYSVLADPQLEAAGVLPHLRRAFGLDGARDERGAGETVMLPAVRYDVASTTGRGQALWTQAHVYPVRAPDGSVERVVLMHFDVTEERRAAVALREAAEALEMRNEQLRSQAVELEMSNQQLQEQALELEAHAEALQASQDQLRTLADAIPTLAWTAREDGFLDWYNARWYEYTGTTPADMEGWGWQSVHDPELLPTVLDRWQASIATGQPFEMIFPLRGADGTFRQFLTRVSPVTDAAGRAVRWFGTNTDVDAELAAHAAAEAARAMAEAANRAKTDFLATMSHELRTPLNAIGGYAELIELGIHGPTTDQQLEALSRIRRSQRHLLGLINDVLNFAKLEAGRVEYDIADVDVTAALDTLEPMVAPQLRAKTLRFSRQACAADARVRADPDKFQQILVNMLSNAIKFTLPGGSVTLRCEVGETTVGIAVTDTGIGVAADRLEHIFEPFVQIDRRLNTPREGTGLGLAISRDLARGMGGDLTVESILGEGSTFRLTLPRAA